MKQFLHKKRNQFAAVILSTAMLGAGIATPIHTDAVSQVTKQQLSPGIDYKKVSDSQKPKIGVDVMEIDASDMFTEVQLGKADPLNNLATVKKRAEFYSKKNNKIMGAINANFYSVKKKRPVHLISEDNRLVYAGYINKDKNGLVNQPIAFGIDKNGKGLIDHYKSKLTYSYKGDTHKISHTNRERAKNNTILYTTDFYKDDTDTNQYGTEVVLEGPKNPELTLGSTLNMTVQSVRGFKATKEPTKIDENSFVLSGHGKGSDRMRNMKVGDTVKINVGMDKKWHKSEFMLAGGPQLVKDGKVDISMNDSWASRAKTSRTAVGIDKERDKIFFVTTDALKQGKDIKDGMTIPELARLMKDLGADSALNLDGGGSTTMAIRPNGNGSLKVMNKLQDGAERGISGILMAADTEPKRVFKDVGHREDLYDNIQWAKKTGMITGYEDNTFRPYNKLSRKHSAAMFARALELEMSAANADNYFIDVPSAHPYDYASEIAAVAKKGIFKGEAKGTGGDRVFRPEETMTRQQMASTIAKAFDLESNHKDKVMINLKSVDQSHQKYVQLLADNGVTTQLKDFRPHEPVTRGQFAAFLQRATEVK